MKCTKIQVHYQIQNAAKWGPVAVTCEHGNESSNPIHSKEAASLSYYQLPYINFPPLS